MEVWLHAFSFAGRTAELARRAEQCGYAGMLVADSQNLNADVWIELALAAAATERLRLGPGVTNPVTRHPAVSASAAATLQEESGGRAVLGLGRGDSALLQIGRRPLPVEEFERGLERIQGLLRGEQVELAGGARSGIGWIAESAQPKVPAFVAATGPRVIAVAARHAEQVNFTVGAEPERLRWAIERARAVPRQAPLSLGAFVDVAVDPDRGAARDLVRGSTAILASFGTQRSQSAPLSDEFLDRFAVCGPAEEVAERLRGLAALGLERLVVVPGSLDADPAAIAASNERFATEVLPALSPA